MGTAADTCTAGSFSGIVQLLAEYRDRATAPMPPHDMYFRLWEAKELESALYRQVLAVIADGRSIPDPAALARGILQAACGTCKGSPPPGFTCNNCRGSG